MTEPVPASAVAAIIAKAPADISLAGYAMLAFGVVIIAVLVVILLKAQLSRTNRIDLTDLLIEQATNKVTPARFWTLIGGAAGTWVFIYLPVSGHFDATYAAAYLAACFGFGVAAVYANKQPPGASSEMTERTIRSEAAPEPVAPVRPAKPKPKGK
jgi:hypothetical protein